MTETNSRYWSPSRTYEFELKIGKKDITPDLYKLTILTSIDIPYQNVILEIFIDPTEFILEKIYGHEAIKLRCKLFGTTPNIPQEQIDFDLLFLDETLPVDNQAQLNEPVVKERKPITINTVVRNSYTIMNTTVNSIFQGKTIQNVLTEIVSETNGNLKLDTNFINDKIIDQILLPPSTLYKNLIFLNNNFGIYNGVPCFFCLYDGGVYIKNLSKKITSSHTFTIYQLSTTGDNEEIYKKVNDGKNFYTKQDILIKNKANSAFALLAPTNKFIVKPKDRLYHTFDIDLETFAGQYGVISQSSKLYFDKKAINPQSRIAYHKDHIGDALNQSFINSNFSKKISELTSISMIIEGRFKMLNLMNVGESVLFNTKITKQTDLAGKYILKASELKFVRSRDWESQAAVQLIRTNRSIS